MWEHERKIAEIEAIAASWHRVLDREQIALLRGQIMRLLRERDNQIYNLRARVAELEAERDKALARAETAFEVSKIHVRLLTEARATLEANGIYEDYEEEGGE